MSTTAMAKVPCGCKAILNKKDPRVPIWRAVFGSLEFPLQSPVPIIGQAQGEHEDRFLAGDLDALTIEQISRLCEEMKKKFHIDTDVFMAQNRMFGYIPIKDKNITIVVCEKHTRMMH